jgi:hypothetical protein
VQPIGTICCTNDKLQILTFLQGGIVMNIKKIGSVLFAASASAIIASAALADMHDGGMGYGSDDTGYPGSYQSGDMPMD